jgi:hypothetical protein
MADTAGYVVAIVVDPDFGDRLSALLERMPVWIADTESNRTAAARARSASTQSAIGHTSIGALTTFNVDRQETPEFWSIGALDDVARHHDRYSHSPGYSAVEVYGATPSPRLLSALAAYRLTEITSLATGGFRASTRDGREAGSPNDS